jgi:hypothetical protein
MKFSGAIQLLNFVSVPYKDSMKYKKKYTMKVSTLCIKSSEN